MLLNTQCRDAAWRVQDALDSSKMGPATAPYLMSETVSALDIAWFVYVHRLGIAGYPFAASHPRLDAWHHGLSANLDWNWEVDPGAVVIALLAKIREARDASGITLSAVTVFCKNGGPLGLIFRPFIIHELSYHGVLTD